MKFSRNKYVMIHSDVEKNYISMIVENLRMKAISE